MKANPDEHLSVESERSRFPFLELFLALAVIGGLVFYWFQSEVLGCARFTLLQCFANT